MRDYAAASIHSDLRVFADAESLSRAAADLFARAASTAVAARGVFRVALAGGGTPKQLYTLLARTPYREGVPWSAVEFFWGDERPVSPAHSDSNFGMAHAALLTPLGIAKDRIHRMQGECPDLDDAAEAYQTEMAHAFGVSADAKPPAFDLILLGMGADGHTASLFPHSEALAEKERWVVANRVAALKTARLTLTYPVLNRARRVLFLVTGGDKAKALAAVREGLLNIAQFPAQGVQPAGGELLWFVNRAAAAELKHLSCAAETGRDRFPSQPTQPTTDEEAQ